MYARIVKPGWLIVCLALVSILSGCESGSSTSSSANDGASTVALPQMMAKGNLYDTGTIYAYLQIDRWWHPSPDDDNR